MDVAGKVVAITGAARGLGQEFARSLAAAGARVVAADVNDCSATLDLVRAEQAEGIAARLDVTDPGSARDMVEAATRGFGRLDALINNAALYGALHGGRFDAIEEAEWDAAMAVNVKGIWNCCKAAVPAMRQSIAQGAGGGSIINIASLAATYGMPYGLHYTTSKAAVIGLTRGLARELGRDHIRVNALAPSAVITEGTREFFGAKLDRALETIKTSQTIQRNLMPSDLAGTVLWLISDASGFVTGQTIGGICRAIAVAFAEAGAAVACCDIDPEAAAETAQQVTAAGGRAVASLRRRERSRHPGRRRRGL
jgi:NAD(P)-dependent dehydrogenase (short-subunit alcohol dehydrogenase family)